MLYFKKGKQGGISLVEVMIAIALTSISIVGLMSIQPQALINAGRTDHLGRAAGILQKELEQAQMIIMNTNNSIPTSDTDPRGVNPSGADAPKLGDFTYSVLTTIANSGTNTWRITVKVTWPGNAAGITGSVVATRQRQFTF